MARPHRNFVPYRNRPKVFIDLETTGVIPGYHEITELAFVHDTKGRWNVRVKPRHIDRAQERAIAISGYNEKDWAQAPYIEEMWERIVSYLEDVIIVGHNVAGFDRPMIEGEARVKKLPGADRISRACEDTQCLALTHLVPRGLNLLGLEACCRFFDIPNEGQHHAYEDALRCKAVYERITKTQQELL